MVRVEHDVGQFYGKHHNEASFHDLSKNRRRDFFQYLKDKGIADVRDLAVMEAGGSGNKSAMLHEAGAKVFFLDLAASNVDFVRRATLGKAVARQGSLLDDHDDLNDQLDLIISNGVIHHTSDPAAALVNMQRWLKIDGRLVLDFYRSGALMWFSTWLVRELLAVGRWSCDALKRQFMIYARPDDHLLEIGGDFLDNALVPLLQPTTGTLVRGDLEKLGFDIRQYDGDDEFGSMKPKVNIVARKSRVFTGSSRDLAYHGGIDQLFLDFPPDVEALVRLHQDLIAKLNSPADAIVLALALARAYHRATYLIDLRHRMSGVKQTGDIGWIWLKKTPLKLFVDEASAVYSRFLDAPLMP